jgi:hypothetical protein
LFRNIFKYVSVIIGGCFVLYTGKLFGRYFSRVCCTFGYNDDYCFRLFEKQKNDTVFEDYTDRFNYSFIAHKSYPMAISNLAIFLMMTLCFEKFKGDETVAYYSIVMKLVLFCS